MGNNKEEGSCLGSMCEIRLLTWNLRLNIATSPVKWDLAANLVLTLYHLGTKKEKS